MAFPVTKVDYLGILVTGVSTGLELKSCKTGNSSAGLAEAKDTRGDVSAREKLPDYWAPSCEYAMSGTAAATGKIVLGTVTAVDNHAVCLKSFSISTSAAGLPSFSAAGEEIETGGKTDATIALFEFSVDRHHKAQLLAGVGTYNDVDEKNAKTLVALTQANYEVAANVTKVTVNGVIKNHDISGCHVTANLTFSQAGAVAPTFTPGDGWIVTEPLSTENPDADFPTWTMTLQKVLASTEPAT